jgi:hypothetical protein
MTAPGVGPITALCFGQFQIEIKGLTEPKSKEAARIICQEDLNEVIAAFVQDRTAIERGIFDDELVPEELTQVRMGKNIKDKYPEPAGSPENTVTISASGYPLSVTTCACHSAPPPCTKDQRQPRHLRHAHLQLHLVAVAKRS